MRKAFTAVEFLIVVTIVTILAVIAVPNFLEAQTRKMTAQSLSNMRAIDSALQAYRVDHQGALPATAMSYWWSFRMGYYIGLSTPVAYMSSVPQDSYNRQFGLQYPSQYGPDYFYEYQLWDHHIIHALLANPVGTAPGMWGPVSPDSTLRLLLQTYFEPAFHRWGHGDATFVLRGWGPNWTTQIYVVPYDPTNGTSSDGQFFYYH